MRRSALPGVRKRVLVRLDPARARRENRFGISEGAITAINYKFCKEILKSKQKYTIIVLTSDKLVKTGNDTTDRGTPLGFREGGGRGSTHWTK